MRREGIRLSVSNSAIASKDILVSLIFNFIDSSDHRNAFVHLSCEQSSDHYQGNFTAKIRFGK